MMFAKTLRMCQFQQLYCDMNGYVIRCNECRHYQVLFNRTVLSLSEGEYQSFLSVAGSYQGDELMQMGGDDVILPTPVKGVHMVLTREQLSILIEMLETSDSESRALALLQLFEV